MHHETKNVAKRAPVIAWFCENVLSGNCIVIERGCDVVQYDAAAMPARERESVYVREREECMCVYVCVCVCVLCCVSIMCVCDV